MNMVRSRPKMPGRIAFENWNSQAVFAGIVGWPCCTDLKPMTLCSRELLVRANQQFSRTQPDVFPFRKGSPRSLAKPLVANLRVPFCYSRLAARHAPHFVRAVPNTFTIAKEQALTANFSQPVMSLRSRASTACPLP
jgi:hypothetical protein